MSLPEIRGAGKLITDPRSGETRTGGRWTNGLVKFQAWKKNGDDWEPGDAVVASVIAFDDVADLLAGYAKGDDIAVQGATSVALWKDQPQLKITLAKVWTPERKPRGADLRGAGPHAGDRRNSGTRTGATTGPGPAGSSSASCSREHDADWPRPAVPQANRGDTSTVRSAPSRTREEASDQDAAVLQFDSARRGRRPNQHMTANPRSSA